MVWHKTPGNSFLKIFFIVVLEEGYWIFLMTVSFQGLKGKLWSIWEGWGNLCVCVQLFLYDALSTPFSKIVSQVTIPEHSTRPMMRDSRAEIS
jgi:hypothetical protein